MVESGYLIPQNVRIGLVEIYPFLDDRLVIAVQWNTARIEQTRAPHVPRLHFEHVEAALARRVEPLADGVAGELWVEHLGPAAAVGIDAPDRARGFEQDVSDIRLDHDLHRHVERHDPRHAAWPAGARVVEMSSCSRLGEIGFENGLIFRGQRRLLTGAERFRRIPHEHWAAGPPLALPIGIFLDLLGPDHEHGGAKYGP